MKIMHHFSPVLSKSLHRSSCHAWGPAITCIVAFALGGCHGNTEEVALYSGGGTQFVEEDMAGVDEWLSRELSELSEYLSDFNISFIVSREMREEEVVHIGELQHPSEEVHGVIKVVLLPLEEGAPVNMSMTYEIETKVDNLEGRDTDRVIRGLEDRLYRILELRPANAI